MSVSFRAYIRMNKKPKAKKRFFSKEICQKCKYCQEQHGSVIWGLFCMINEHPCNDIVFHDGNMLEKNGDLNHEFKIPKNCPYLLEHALV